jgi:type VI protein secretion system component Hcp
MAQRRPDVRVAKLGQALARGAAWDSAEALLDIAVLRRFTPTAEVPIFGGCTMIARLLAWLVPVRRRPRRSRTGVRPVPEALESREVLSISIAVNLGGLLPPVVSVTLPQPTVSGVQDVSLVLRPSAADPQLFKDAADGTVLRHVKITLSDGAEGRDKIHLSDARISSIHVIQGQNQQTPLIALTVEGRAGQNGSIAANVDGVTPTVVSLTIPQPPASGPQEISLVIKESKGVTKLFQDAAQGKSIPEVDITLDRLGNPTTDTIILTHAIIASFQVLETGDIPNVEIGLVAETETIRQS